MSEEVQPMTPGGVWLSEGGGTGTPQYVVNPDHIARLQREGYQAIADPRIPAEFNEPEKGEEVNDDTSGRVATVSDATDKPGTGELDTTSG